MNNGVHSQVRLKVGDQDRWDIRSRVNVVSSTFSCDFHRFRRGAQDPTTGKSVLQYCQFMVVSIHLDPHFERARCLL